MRSSSNPARLNVTSAPAPVTGAAAGLHPLALDRDRDALLYIPEACFGAQKVPLIVSLHGAGGDAHHGIELLRWLADRRAFLLLAPASRAATWDVIVENYGPDVRFIERAIEETYRRCAVDTSAIAVAGFSDGASYALSLGLANGRYFRAILAYSPGFKAPPVTEGKPDIFVSHGTRDQVLPVDQCSRVLVHRMKVAGLHVVYREFDGPHTIPREVAANGVDVFLGSMLPRPGTGL